MTPDAVLERRHLRRRAAEVLVALVPGTVLPWIGWATFQWGLQRKQVFDDEMYYAVGVVVGTVLLVLGFVVLTTAVVVMPMYLWRERKRHPSGGGS